MSLKNLWKNLAVVTASLLVAIALTEAALRFTGFRPPVLDRRMFVANADSLLPFRLAPNYSGNFAGGKVTIDSEGFREVRPRAAGATVTLSASDTLLLLGDSQIFGQGLDDDETPASQLQDSLLARGQSIRVLNIGVPGYTSWNEYAALRDFLASHHVDQVILSYIPNDPTFDNDFFRLNQGKFTGVSDSRLHRFTQSLYRHVYTAFLLSDGLRRIRFARKRELPPLVPSDSAVEYSMAALERIRELLDRQSTRFAVGLYRDVSTYSNPKETQQYEQKIAAALTKHGFDWFLMAGHVANLNRSEAAVTWSDPHPSARGTAFIVSDVLRFLGDRWFRDTSAARTGRRTDL